MHFKNLKKIILPMILFCLASVHTFAQDFEYAMERAMAQEILITLQNNDFESFSTYCITEERFSKMLAEMGEESQMEIEIKSELSEVPFEEFIEELTNGFNNAMTQIEEYSFNINESVYPELAFYKTRFEVTNLKSVKVKVDISTDQAFMMKIDFFKTSDDLFIYDFALVKDGRY